MYTYVHLHHDEPQTGYGEDPEGDDGTARERDHPGGRLDVEGKNFHHSLYMQLDEAEIKFPQQAVIELRVRCDKGAV